MAETAQTQSIASGAATGAKIGSGILPGIGTVIGAVVGAVVGWLAGGKKKPVRASAEQIAQCKSLISEYMGYAAQMPAQPIPLDYQQLLDLHWCLQAVYGGHYIGVKDPRWFNPGVEAALLPAAKILVRKIYETKVGATVQIDAITFKDPKGRSLSFQGFNFTNPEFSDFLTLTTQVWMPMAIQYCQNTAGKGAPGCPDYYHTPEFRRWLYDVIAWAARTELPNISESDLKAASQVATQTGSAAKDVVTAVEQIIGRTVQSGETAALLTPATTPVSPPSSTTPPATAPPVATPGVSSDITSLISQLIAQGASTQQALTALTNQGVTPTSQVQQAVQQAATQAGTGGGLLNNPWVLGAAAVIGLSFALARPRGRH